MLTESNSVSDIKKRFDSLLFGRSGVGIVQNLVLFNLLVNFLRPHDIVPILGTIRLPMIVSILCIIPLLFRLSGEWPKTMKIITFFLLVECIRLVVGLYVIEDFVINDFWQFQMIKDLALQYFGLVFPLMLFFSSQRGLKRVSSAWTIIAIMLPLWVVTHGGKGMGGFLGDENDVGLTMIFFLALILSQFIELRRAGAFGRFLKLIAIVLTVVAVIATNSRGTFLGLVCLFGYFFLRSRRKFLMIIFGIVLVSAIIPFVPKAYYDRIATIKDTNSGTANIRRHYWSLAFKVFTDPAHTLWGVGLENVKFHLGDYETGSDLQQYPGSSGRAVHSIYFELLPDLGLWGVGIVGSLVFICFSGNRRSLRKLERSAVLIDDKRRALSILLERMTPAEASQHREKENLLAQSAAALNYLRSWLLGTNAGFVTIATAGAFISVLYYPMLWINIGLCTALAIYSKNLFDVVDEIEKLEIH